MSCIHLCYFLLTLIGIVQINGSYECGIRKHSHVPLVYHGWKVEEGHWPWHVTLNHLFPNETAYRCGGTLIDQQHVVTAAHCVVRQETTNPMSPRGILLHFGQQSLSQKEKNVQVRDIVEIHVHPEYSPRRNDIAVLKLRLPVEYTDYVIPICLDRRVDKDLRMLEGQRGWIAGWGATQNGTVSDELQTASLPVVSYLQCFQGGSTFSRYLEPNVFCAGDRNGTSPGRGDSGGGMYFIDGDRWVLRGIVSYAKVNEFRLQVDTTKYAVFVNVQRFFFWIRGITEKRKWDWNQTGAAKRISEKECYRFKSFVQKRRNGICSNSRYPHTVSLVNSEGKHMCTGTLLNENHVLTACSCHFKFNITPSMVQISEFGALNISSFICHPEYNDSSFHHDIAIARLASTVKLSYNIVPACLASNRTENLYETVMATGFRKTHFSNVEEFFESDTNDILTADECKRNGSLDIVQGQLCVMNNDIASSTDYGLIGASLQTASSRPCLVSVVGVLSNIVFGPVAHNNRTNALNIFSRVSDYLGWLEDTVWGETVGPEILRPKRESDTECNKFAKLARRRSDGSCLNTNYPNMVYLIDPNGYERCTGILVNVMHALTTCYCKGHQEFTPSTLRIGTYGTVGISRITCHPLYDETKRMLSKYDIAVVRLRSPVKLSNSIIPACLASSWAENQNAPLLTTGLRSYFRGNIYDSEEYVTRERYFYESYANQVIPEDECNRYDWIRKSNTSIGSTQMCVINHDKQFGMTLEHSGTPLQTFNARTCMFTVLGVLSVRPNTAYGDEGKPDIPAVNVFSRVAPLLDWLEDTIWDGSRGSRYDGDDCECTSSEERAYNASFNWVLKGKK